tara:strand:+ start:83 stop:670 length:588 start_codon:yes stop_codon:yes gene_type:complete
MKTYTWQQRLEDNDLNLDSPELHQDFVKQANEFLALPETTPQNDLDAAAANLLEQFDQLHDISEKPDETMIPVKEVTDKMEQLRNQFTQRVEKIEQAEAARKQKEQETISKAEDRRKKQKEDAAAAAKEKAAGKMTEAIAEILKKKTDISFENLEAMGYQHGGELEINLPQFGLYLKKKKWWLAYDIVKLQEEQA